MRWFQLGIIGGLLWLVSPATHRPAPQSLPVSPVKKEATPVILGLDLPRPPVAPASAPKVRRIVTPVAPPVESSSSPLAPRLASLRQRHAQGDRQATCELGRGLYRCKIWREQHQKLANLFTVLTTTPMGPEAEQEFVDKLAVDKSRLDAWGTYCAEIPAQDGLEMYKVLAQSAHQGDSQAAAHLVLHGPGMPLVGGKNLELPPAAPASARQAWQDSERHRRAWQQSALRGGSLAVLSRLHDEVTGRYANVFFMGDDLNPHAAVRYAEALSLALGSDFDERYARTMDDVAEVLTESQLAQASQEGRELYQSYFASRTYTLEDESQQLDLDPARCADEAR